MPALAAEACRQDLADSREEWLGLRGGHDIDALAHVEHYLRRGHVDDIASGCFMAAYSGEIVRREPEVAAALADGTSRMAGLMEEALRKRMLPEPARSRALFLTAATVGTVMMTTSRARGPDGGTNFSLGSPEIHLGRQIVELSVAASQNP